MENLEISKLKLAIVYGKELVDGKSKNGIMTRIYKDQEDDTAHFYYLKEFLKTNFKDNESIQNADSANTILYELAHSGHIVFAENTSLHNNKTGLIFMPDNLTDKQKNTMAFFEEQLNKENYTITVLSELSRNEENTIMGKQKIGSPSILNYFLKQQSVEPEL